ncbi:hypothetical protein KXW98_002214 [Aspergillus fumigatus]|uniref:RING-type E3 ubiquitin transferase n=1 Tax=Aspergillus fumigatus TaxID=746128 RepID=A0A229Y7E4_ASPFM|nr:hypothetical protein CNMCM8714_000234 [Aspergillus fumigatus]KMK62425.1 PA and RING finger domain-containing protein [Aspergillus fumigatus Z5]KAF4278020.1 hypothetical protein CNMCM8057_001606 [Aspergillus fumigatus]KAH1276059.1 hypothetical protein KXX45_005626 [Aspergillus fumigatus]KAH1290578.1 hypothetical protein KXX48_007900 [Aspergillus fumigatus]
MRPPRLVSIVFCILFFPIFLTLFSALSSSPRVADPSSLAGQTTGFHAFFSFNIPSSLFPPSAIISLTDDNSTFFLARPAAFGPLLSDKGLSGPLWVGSGFGEKTSGGAEGELGCSDIPGWGDGDSRRSPDKSTIAADKTSSSGIRDGLAASLGQHRADPQQESDSEHLAAGVASPPSTNDGTDDHLHHPLPDSDVVDAGAPEKPRERQNKPAAHADIQSLQESAEIDGKVVLLSRGGCGFLEKVKWAQRRGAIAVIVGDDTRGGSLVTMYARGDTSNVTIPAVFTSYTTAHLLSSLMPPQAGAESSLDEKAGSTRTVVSSGPDKQRLSPTTTTSVTPSSTPTTQAAVDEQLQTAPRPKTGFFHSLLSLLGLGRSNNGHALQKFEDSRRPPNSGNIDWVRLGDKQQSNKPHNSAAHDRKESESVSSLADGDGFIIGVQDWRDPDLVPARTISLPSPSSVASSAKTESGNSAKSQKKTSNSPKGGSITPGSGEYRSVDRSSDNKEVPSRDGSPVNSAGNAGSDKGWFFKRFFAPRRTEGANLYKPANNKMRRNTDQNAKVTEHEGLWVTLTPTSMSTSPFFDTLLVLVVSPLLTLTVVYALLLIRSRIRRRRWRAPKSIVERLPVRTYHTIPTPSSAASSSRSSSPGPVSPTSPLLGSRSRPELAPSRSSFLRSGTAEAKKTRNMDSAKGEKSGSASSVWRRKYTGRQVECVVCLEEYIDGQSRVMSLPCGHEFHAECITPWLTTRRRTCPICKGDVVRSMAQNTTAESRDSSQRMVDGDDHRGFESHRSVSSAPMLIANPGEEETSAPEHYGASDLGPLQGHASSAPPSSSWRNMASLSLSALSGDTIWHQTQPDNDR